jgi:plasmid stability protein
MSKMIQIRNVPDDLHGAIKVKAAKSGMSLSDYLLRLISQEVRQLTLEEWFERVRELEPVEPDEDAAVTIRKIRGPLTLP